MQKTVTIERSEYESLIAYKIEVVELKQLVKYYQHQLLAAKRRQFGVSSEKLDSETGQLKLFGSEPATITAAPETEEIHYTRKKRKGKREEDLSGLPVERIDYELSEAERSCPQCGQTMRDMGVEIRKELKLIPAKVVVVEHTTHTYACRNCESNGFKTPFAKGVGPTPLLSGSLASPSMAHIAVQKYLSGMPLYRIENGFRYDGVDISRQTMTNWVIHCSERYLEGIYGLLKAGLLEETVIHADGTVVQVLREPGRKAQTKSCEWVYRTSSHASRQIAVYEYTETKSQEHPKRFLKGFEGLLHTDGEQCYHNLPEEITVVGCWAHLRRKLESILKNIPQEQWGETLAGQGMTYISALFALERKFSELTPEERKAERLENSKPVADAFFAWAAGLMVLPRTPLGEAVAYALSQRVYLQNVFLDGRTEISNNLAERTVKPFVMGRKAWLFSTSPAGARASSVIYSIIETAKANGLHPFRYMEFLLESLPGSTTSELETLLPWSDSLPETCRAPQKEKR